MANPLRKTMVYLGLADEDYEYEQGAPAAPVTAPAGTRKHRDRRTAHPSLAAGTK